MKKLNIIIMLVLFVSCLQKVNAQVINWNTVGTTKHIINANFGLDYSLSYGIGYGYKLDTKLPIIIDANVSMPSGEKPFDDFKTKVGGQIQLLNRSNFIGALGIYGIYRRHETEFVRLQNFGSEMKGTFGYYKSKWFVAAEAGFDKAIVTNFKHSQEYRENIYADVVDGWYEPATGGNFNFGILTGVSFKQSDIFLKGGIVTTQNFSTPLLPFYAQLGYTARFGQKK